MLFNSLHFFIFFPITTLLFFLLTPRLRWLLLLGISCYFYMAFMPIYILILFFLILVDYFAGIAIEPAQGKKRAAFLIVSLAANISILGFFKYYGFLSENMSQVLSWFGLAFRPQQLNIILPIGLSFHTFQAMSYTIEVYFGRQKAERNLGVYALYVMFYPQLVAGPIERPQHLMPQFHQIQYFDYTRATSGIRLMLWGLFKKMVIADNLGYVADQVFNLDLAHFSVSRVSGWSVLFALYCFAFQIYCDFSGYSDIAIGAARVLGFDLSPNFTIPYISRSIPEFWSRWHISLSTWFRDYLFTPLALKTGRAHIAVRHLVVIFVFMVSGLWHGANWTFVVWGGLHGFYTVMSRWSRKVENAFFSLLKIPATIQRLIQIVLTFHLVCLAWIFFRANSVNHAWQIAERLASIFATPVMSKANLLFFNSIGYGRWIGICCGMLLLYIVEYKGMSWKIKWSDWLDRQPTIVRWSTYYACVMAIWILKSSDSVQFIYFQF